MNTDMEVHSLRTRVSKLEAEMRFLYKHLGVTFVPTYEVDPIDRDVVEWLKKKNDIQAIATYRNIHKVGLPEAKAAVDEMRAGLGL